MIKNSNPIADGSITEAKLSTAVQTKLNTIADGIADLSITEAKLANGAVTYDKLANNAVTNTRIANNAITHEKLSSNCVQSHNIVDGSILGSDICGNTITSANILDGSILGTDISGNTITSANIVDGAITNTKLGALAVTHDKIDALAITEAKINTGAVTNTKLGDLSISDGKIQVGTITLQRLTPEVQALINAGGGGATIADGSITLQKLSSAVQTILSTLQQPRGIINIFSSFTSTKPFLYDLKKYNSATSTFDPTFTFGDVIVGGSVSNYFILPTTATHMKIELNTLDEKLNGHIITQGATEVSSARGGRDLVIALDTINGYNNISIGYEVVLNTNVGWYGTFRVNNINTTPYTDTGRAVTFSIYVGSTQIVTSHTLENNTNVNNGTTSFDYVFEKWERLATSSSTIRFVIEGFQSDTYVDDVLIFGSNMNVVSGTLIDTTTGDAQLQMGIFTYPFNVRIDIGSRLEP